MKSLLFLTLSYLSTVVWAGGYQGCLERVWLYQAYQIDALLPTAQQTIGFKCRDGWDADTRSCPGVYLPCAITGRCNFDQLVHFLGKAPAATGWTVNDANGDLDVEKAAVRCYEKYLARNGKVPNFRPDRAMKGTGEYNDFIKLTKHVNAIYKTHNTPANRHLWEKFDRTLGKINLGRTGDHGPYLFNYVQNKLGATSRMNVAKI